MCNRCEGVDSNRTICFERPYLSDEFGIFRLHVGQYLLHQELVGGVGGAGAVGATGAAGAVGATGAAGAMGAVGATGALELRELWEQRELPDM